MTTGADHPSTTAGTVQNINTEPAVPLQTWALLRQVFTVETLMTPCQDLLTAEQGTDPAAALDEARHRRFDLLPVTVEGRITGLLRTETGQPEPLAAPWLVTRDTPIPDLLGLFVETGRPGFLVLSRQEIVGLVTPADLNKLPARIYLYHLLGEVEQALALRIRHHVGEDAGQAMQMLSARRRTEIEDHLALLADGNVDVDPMQLLRLSDVINIAAKHATIRAELGFPSRRATENALNGLNDLRNRTMHPVRPLLERIPEDLERLQRYGQQAGEVLRRLAVA